MNDQPLTKSMAIEKRLNTDVANTTAMTIGGGLVIENVMQAMEIAKLMAISGLAVRAHVRDNPGMCFGIVIQAMDWGMSPYAVANKSYSVNNQLAYESQLIQAVILRRAPIKGRIRFTYEGEGPTRRCTASATTTDGEIVEYRSPMFSEIKVKNSPLWTADPDQQFSYFAGRSLCRRHFPDVLLGIYDPEELEGAEQMKNVTPKDSGLVKRLAPETVTGGFDPDGVTAALKGESDNTMRFFHHPESDSIFTTDGEDPENGDGMLVEIDLEKYREIEARQLAETEFDPEIQRAGSQAAIDGDERKAPDDLSPAGCMAWLSGYDAIARAA